MLGRMISGLCLRPLRAAALFVSVVALNSCVPLLLLGAGAGVGYVARDKGVGVAPPLDSGSSEPYEAPAYDEGGADYDAPVY